MIDPMTEGAKTGTGTGTGKGKAYTIPQIRRCLEGWLSANGDNTSGTAAIHNFLLCLECDQDGIEADTKRMESRDLTEALKVAGENIWEFQLITDSSDYGLNNMNTVEGRVEYYKRLRVVKAKAHNALAALERIRNQSLS